MEEKALAEGIISNKFLLLGKNNGEVIFYEIVYVVGLAILAGIGIFTFLSYFIRPELKVSCIPGMGEDTFKLISLLTLVVGGVVLCLLGYIIQILLILIPIIYILKKTFRYWYEHNVLYEHKNIKYQLTKDNLILGDEAITINLHQSPDDLSLLIFRISDRTQIKGCMIEFKNKEIFKETIEYFGTECIFIDKAPNGLDSDFTAKSIRDLSMNHRYLKDNSNVIVKKGNIIKNTIENILQLISDLLTGISFFK